MSDKQGRVYEITPRPESLSGGWKLTLLEDGEEAGGGVFPIPEEAPQVGIQWWNSIPEPERAYWLVRAASAMPAAARHAFLLAEAYEDAQQEGQSWAAS